MLRNIRSAMVDRRPQFVVVGGLAAAPVVSADRRSPS